MAVSYPKPEQITPTKQEQPAVRSRARQIRKLHAGEGRFLGSRCVLEQEGRRNLQAFSLISQRLAGFPFFFFSFGCSGKQEEQKWAGEERGKGRKEISHPYPNSPLLMWEFYKNVELCRYDLNMVDGIWYLQPERTLEDGLMQIVNDNSVREREENDNVVDNFQPNVSEDGVGVETFDEVVASVIEERVGVEAHDGAVASDGGNLDNEGVSVKSDDGEEDHIIDILKLTNNDIKRHYSSTAAHGTQHVNEDDEIESDEEDRYISTLNEKGVKSNMALVELKRIKPSAVLTIMNTHLRFWSKAFFKEANKCDVVDNMCEVVNGLILEARHKAIFSMMEDLRAMCGKRTVVRQEYEIANLLRILVPKFGQKLLLLEQVVGEAHFYGLVVKGMRHAVIVINYREENDEDYVAHWFNKHMFMASYENEVPVIEGMHQWKETRMPPMDPPIPRKMPNRHKKKRLLEEWEGKTKVGRKGRLMTYQICIKKGTTQIM
ncbi:hypothetical protein SLEP1_g3045 [Rubroshorea leprosula]|uniref:Uncharacterized protein n=1 Tax=Rubroshorea leprosula TaxID=152421 RepID=A0AAV5HQJ9_9ROSI|nr:hypothetical protein SLEP1_g3045 [Rubroshorea leprosula]